MEININKSEFKSLKSKIVYLIYIMKIPAILKSDLISFMKANSNYEDKDCVSLTQTKMMILVGSKERLIMKKSAKNISNLISKSKSEILKGYCHGDISINHADEYAEIIKRLVC